MKKYFAVKIWTDGNKLLDYNFEKFENAIIFASREKERFHSISEESFLDNLVE